MFLASGDPHHLDGVADHVGRALLAFGSFRHAQFYHPLRKIAMRGAKYLLLLTKIATMQPFPSEVFMKSMWLILCMLVSAAVASAHKNDRGMNYESYKDRQGNSCCDDRDCRPAADFVVAVENGEAVVRLLIDGIWISVSRSYVVAHFSHGWTSAFLR